MFEEIVLKERWLYPLWQSLPLIPSHSAMNELWRYYLTLEDVKHVLEEGYDCSESRRKRGIIERCLRKDGKIIKVVVASSYNHSFSTDCWVITHVGLVHV